MSGDAWLCLAVVAAVVAGVALTRVPTPAVMAGGLLVLFVTDAVTDEVALSGLSSPATATIGLLYVVAGGIAATGAMSWLLDRLLFGRRGGLPRLATATAAMSSFVPNTPLVALAAPRVVRWSRLNGTPASKLLLPLSFASILGGVITVLGTSTNLVVSDALLESGDDALGMFEIAPVGLPVALVGIGILSLSAPRLLRDRQAAHEAMSASAREFQLQMIVEPDGPLDGLTIAAAGLRDLSGLYLAGVERNDEVVTARPETRLIGSDRLFFVGDVAQVIDLQDTAGLVSAELDHVLGVGVPGARLYEAVIGTRSDLVGNTLRSVSFRGRYGAAVLAVHRADADLRGKLGTIALEAGDVLLLLAPAAFERHWREHGDFALVASLDDIPPARRARAWVAAVIFASMVALAAADALSLFEAAACAAAAMLLTRVVTLAEARRSVDLGVVATIAMSISLGNAVAATGLAAEVADRMVDLTAGRDEFVLVLVLVVTTQLLTEVITNSGAAALMVPIAMGAASAAGADPRALAIAVLVGASCSFLTPIGYQTNMMVYGLGGYRFGDYTRVGLPLTVSCALVTAAITTLV